MLQNVRILIDAVKSIFKPNVDTKNNYINAQAWIDELHEQEELLLTTSIDEEPVVKPKKRGRPKKNP